MVIAGILSPDLVFMIMEPKSILYLISDALLRLKLDLCFCFATSLTASFLSLCLFSFF